MGGVEAALTTKPCRSVVTAKLTKHDTFLTKQRLMNSQETQTMTSPLDIFAGTVAYLLETVGGYKDGVEAAVDRSYEIAKGIIENDYDGIEPLRTLLIQAQGASNLLEVMEADYDEEHDLAGPPSDFPEDGQFVDWTDPGQTNPFDAIMSDVLTKAGIFHAGGPVTSSPGPVLFGEGGAGETIIPVDHLPDYLKGSTTTTEEFETPQETAGERAIRNLVASVMGTDPSNIVIHRF